MRRLFLLLLILIAAYVAYPYWTLYRLEQALLTDSTESLEKIVDFPAIRAGLKGQVEGGMLAKTDELAKKRPVLGDIGRALTEAFGPSIVGGTVDNLVTPETVLKNPTVVEHRKKDEGFEDFVHYAFFSGPTTFKIELKDPDDASLPTITSFMSLDGFRWRVTKVEMPPLKTLIPSGN